MTGYGIIIVMDQASFLLFKAVLGLAADGKVNTELYIYFDAEIQHDQAARKFKLKNPRGVFVRDDMKGTIVFDETLSSKTLEPATREQVEAAMKIGIEKDY